MRPVTLQVVANICPIVTDLLIFFHTISGPQTHNKYIIQLAAGTAYIYTHFTRIKQTLIK